MKKTLVLIGLVAIIVVGPTLLGGEEIPPAPDYHAIPEKFFRLLSEGKPGEAVDYVFGLNPWLQRKTDEVEKVKTALTSMTSMMGEYGGYELITEKTLGSRFVHLVYLGFYDRQPVRFHIQFYKRKNGWITYSVSFDDNFASDLAEAAKADSLLPGCLKQK